MSRRPTPPLLQFLPLLALAVLALPGCMMYERMRMALDPPALPRPTQIRFDPYGALELEAAYAAFAETRGVASTAAAAAGVLIGDEALLQHLRMIDARYAGRRMPRLTWTAEVRRVPPLGSPEDRRGTPVTWDVAIVSSKVRNGGSYYQCDARVSAAGVNLSGDRDPASLCRWQDQVDQDFTLPRY
jgi:hypothetical protein